jgi:hypothetical protein
MEGRLKKIGNEYKLYAQDDSCIATTHESPYKKLSLKNCEAIANGYDLDEVVEDIVKTIVPNDRGEDIWYGTSMAVGKLCFQKALEILGDKKFSESNLRIGCSSLLNLEKEEGELSEVFTEKQYRHIDNYIQSLQQTEWDVEIEMICPHPEDTYVCGIQYGCDEDGCNHPNQIPYLDSDSCLILKRK